LLLESKSFSFGPSEAFYPLWVFGESDYCPRKEALANITVNQQMAKWECLVCGWIYDEEKGDPDSGVEPGTKFEDIPDDWVCPMCGASKDDFEKISD